MTGGQGGGGGEAEGCFSSQFLCNLQLYPFLYKFIFQSADLSVRFSQTHNFSTKTAKPCNLHDSASITTFFSQKSKLNYHPPTPHPQQHSHRFISLHVLTNKTQNCQNMWKRPWGAWGRGATSECEGHGPLSFEVIASKRGHLRSNWQYDGGGYKGCSPFHASIRHRASYLMFWKK